jgi:hypothetical protein
MDRNEVRRLAGKVVADTNRQRVNAKRYPWAVVREWAIAWLAADGSSAGTVAAPITGKAMDGRNVVIAPVGSDAEDIMNAIGELDAYKATGAALVALYREDIAFNDLTRDDCRKLLAIKLVTDAGTVTNKGVAVARLLEVEESAPVDLDKARDLADHISAAQADAFLSARASGTLGGAGKATVRALVNKGLITEPTEHGDFDITALGGAVAAILAGKGE